MSDPTLPPPDDDPRVAASIEGAEALLAAELEQQLDEIEADLGPLAPTDSTLTRLAEALADQGEQQQEAAGPAPEPFEEYLFEAEAFVLGAPAQREARCDRAMEILLAHGLEPVLSSATDAEARLSVTYTVRAASGAGAVHLAAAFFQDATVGAELYLADVSQHIEGPLPPHPDDQKETA